MGGRPRVHGSGDNQEELGHYRLNLSEQQLIQIANILCIEPGSDFEEKLLSGQGTQPPADDQEFLITYKGRYVRIRYEGGEPQVIRPGDPAQGPSGS